jgi:uncharacterized protein
LNVIDLHVHINAFHRLKPEAYRVLEEHQSDFASLIKYTKDPEAFIALMDEQEIERAALINYVAPHVMGYKPDVNQWIYDYTKGRRDRLIAFGGLDPTTAEAKDDPKGEVEKLLSTYELDGIKIHPPHTLVGASDYKAGSGALEILYQACQDQGVPVMVHTGTTIFPGARNRFGDPMSLDDVAVDFPKLKIIMAHGGRPLWMDTAAFLLRRHPNIWMDISSIPPKFLLNYFPRLESLSHRVVFGSDWPGPSVPSMRANADAIAALGLTNEATKAILHDNAAKLFS